jgi:hypothetical protein
MIEDMKQWLEALQDPLSPTKRVNAITSLRQAIREHAMYEVQRLGQEIEQEPVAWLEPEWGERICPEIGFEATITSDHPRDLCWIPLYPHPPQRTWVELTDEEILKSEWAIGANDVLLNFARAIEVKLKEKNNA